MLASSSGWLKSTPWHTLRVPSPATASTSLSLAFCAKVSTWSTAPILPPAFVGCSCNRSNWFCTTAFEATLVPRTLHLLVTWKEVKCWYKFSATSAMLTNEVSQCFSDVCC